MLKTGAVWALGAMSGTSLDGVDAAMVRTDGERILDFGPTAYRPYSAEERAILQAALGQWPGESAVAAAARVVEAAHLEVLSGFSGVDLVGFHGQTLAHDPASRRTHQTGNGAVLARRLGVSVVWDFRSSDVAMGGQGAPLVPFFHFACAKRIGATQPLAFLNLGGVGNVTWVDPRHAAPDQPGAVLAFDTGPANAPISDLLLTHTGQAFDEGGKVAAAGTVDTTALKQFLRHGYFLKLPPKSLDRNEFQEFLRVDHLSLADAAATLTAAAAAAAAEGAAHFPMPVAQMLVCGGGRHNVRMMAELSARLAVDVRPVEAVGLDGDMMEAQAFAYLAVRVARGMPTSGPSTTGVAAFVGGGQLSKPDAAA